MLFRCPSACVLTGIRLLSLGIPPNGIPRPPSDPNAILSWISQFKTITIPRQAVHLTFSRSSGPGGQNVNKVNTKTTLRCPLHSYWIPSWAKPTLQKSRYYVASTQSILITSTLHRSQHQNIHDCLSKLHSLVLSASTSSSPLVQSSEEQQTRVARFVTAEKSRRRIEKSKRSAVKKSRTSSADWD